MTEVERTVAGMRARTRAARAAGLRVALVPTMGALHDGHLALVERARSAADVVVVSVFVNPLQFGPGEDFDRYPRDLDADVAALRTVGADLVLAPDPQEMYPPGGGGTTVHAGPVGGVLEGAARPGHFDGVLTVVLKLLQVVGPDSVVFGRKDAQQVFLVRTMVRDLDVPVGVEVVDTVREPDGLARSSRNRYLAPADRLVARAIPAALDAAVAAAAHGVGAALAAARGVLASADGVRPEYVEAVDPASFRPVADGYRGEALLLVAARVGAVRLIDNRRVDTTG